MNDQSDWRNRQNNFFDDLPPPPNAGHFRWSDDKLRALRPELFGVSGAFYSAFVWLGKQFNDRQLIKECLEGAHCQPAVVMSVAPLLVAAYSSELDAVVLLRFPDHFAQQYRLTVGTRLLTANCYGAEAYPPDIVQGPGSAGTWDNIIPTIAEFASDDAAQIDQLKRQIPESEWQRAFLLGQQYFQQFPGVFRDGRPYFAAMPLHAAREYEQNLTRAQNSRMTYIGGLGGGLLLMLLMCGGLGTAVAFFGRNDPRNQPVAQVPPVVAQPANPAPMHRRPAPMAPAPFVPAPAFVPGGAFPLPGAAPPIPVVEEPAPPVEATSEPPPAPPPVVPAVNEQPATPLPPAISAPEPFATEPPAEEPPAARPVENPPAQESPVPTKFRRGQKAFAEWAGKWEPVEILEVMPGNQYKIRWTNWGPQWDEVRAGDRLAASMPGGGAPAGGRPGRDGEPGIVIDDRTVLADGDTVHAYWLGQWVTGKVAGTQGRSFVLVRVAVPGAGEQEVPLPRQRIRLPESAVKPAARPTATASRTRTWTDSSGNFRLEAKFIAFEDGQVTLEKAGGMQIKMPLEKLSAADQKFVTEQALQP